MNSRTLDIKKDLKTLKSVEERLEFLIDKFKDKKAVILAPGPSLNEYDLQCIIQWSFIKWIYNVCLRASSL